MGFGKKLALQILGVSIDHLAEPLTGSPVAFPDTCISPHERELPMGKRTNENDSEAKNTISDDSFSQ